MKKTRCLAAMLAPMLCLPLPAAGEEAPAELGLVTITPEALAHAQLEFSEAREKAVPAGFEASGTVELNEDRLYTIVPRIGAVLAKNLCAPGEHVEQGDVLANLESRELAEALMDYVKAEHQLEFARAALGRERDLYERKVSSQELLQVKELEFTRAQLAHTASLQPLLLLHYDEITIHRFADNPNHANLTLLQLRAPAAGEVIAREAHSGQAVGADTVLFQVADLSELWVDFYLSLADAELVAPGREVTLRSSVSEAEATASVIYVAPVAEISTRRVLVRAVLENKESRWRPGTPVVVSGGAAAGEAEGLPTLRVPATAVVDLAGEKVVFVREADDRLRVVAVETGPSDGEWTEVHAGLREGEEVASRNAAQLKAQWQLQGEE